MINEELKFDFTFTYKLNNDCNLYEIMIKANQITQIFKFVADKKCELKLINFIKTYTFNKINKINESNESNESNKSNEINKINESNKINKIKKTKIMKFHNGDLMLRTLNDDGTKLVACTVIKGQNNIDNLLSKLLNLLEDTNKLKYPQYLINSQSLKNLTPQGLVPVIQTSDNIQNSDNEPLKVTDSEEKDTKHKNVPNQPIITNRETRIITYLIDGAIDKFDNINNKLDITIWNASTNCNYLKFTMNISVKELAIFFAPIMYEETRSQSYTEKLLYIKECNMLDIITIDDNAQITYRIRRNAQSISNILNMFKKFLIGYFDDF